jgi:hypothetical protein
VARHRLFAWSAAGNGRTGSSSQKPPPANDTGAPNDEVVMYDALHMHDDQATTNDVAEDRMGVGTQVTEGSDEPGRVGDSLDLAMDGAGEMEWTDEADVEANLQHPFDEPPGEKELTRGAQTYAAEHLSGAASSSGHLAEGDLEDNERRVRRRLNVKTSAPPGNAVVASPAIAEEDTAGDLLSRREAKAEAARHAAKRRKWAHDQEVVDERARNYVESHPSLLERAGSAAAHQPDQSIELMNGPTIHISHDMAYARVTKVAYCRNCAAWTRGVKARLLKAPCVGVRVEQSSLLRRLELDVDPVLGRVPAELKRRGARGTRGGR